MVVDSRGCEGGGIRRRRECGKCGDRFTTYETLEKNIKSEILKELSPILIEKFKVAVIESIKEVVLDRTDRKKQERSGMMGSEKR